MSSTGPGSAGGGGSGSRYIKGSSGLGRSAAGRGGRDGGDTVYGFYNV